MKCTPLHWATSEDRVKTEIIKILLASEDCDLNILNGSGKTPLMGACLKNSTDHLVVRILGVDL